MQNPDLMWQTVSTHTQCPALPSPAPNFGILSSTTGGAFWAQATGLPARSRGLGEHHAARLPAPSSCTARQPPAGRAGQDGAHGNSALPALWPAGWDQGSPVASILRAALGTLPAPSQAPCSEQRLPLCPDPTRTPQWVADASPPNSPQRAPAAPFPQDHPSSQGAR